MRDHPASLIARLDRIPAWSLSRLALVVVGLGMLFVQYDIFNINASFAQTCVEIVAGCTPETSVAHIGAPILASLVGYALGAVVLGALSDRYGRRPLLIVSMLVTGVGSLWSALSNDPTAFMLSRLVTGIGIGADLAIINTYMSEVAPVRQRARFTSVLFLLAAFGAAAGIWLGLLLTTPSTPWPTGLPFGLASDAFDSGWRWVYGIGAILAAFSMLLRVRVPESPRWLVAAGRSADAAPIVEAMEERAARRGTLPAPAAVDASAPAVEWRTAPDGVSALARQVGALLRVPTYRRRLAVLSISWALAYVTLYAFGGAFVPVLVGVGSGLAEAGMIAAIGILGFIVAAVVSVWLSERLERRWWMLVGSAIAALGAVVVALSGGDLLVAGIGGIVLMLGQNVWVAPQYALTAESFPTHVRVSAYAIADSLGHVGGGIGVFLVAPLIPGIDPLVALLMLVGFLVVGGVVNLAAPATRGRRLEEVAA